MLSLRRLLYLFIVISSYPAHADANREFLSLCYHDVRDQISDKIPADIMAVSSNELVTHFSWLKAHGYNVVSLDDVLKAKAGLKALPKKAILLTFDDGYESFYSRVYPLLKLFNYPAVLALVGSWMDTEDSALVQYGNAEVARKNFLTWDQVKEMADSGLVELASHSYELHQGVLANPQRNLEPAATTRIFDETNASYESDQKYYARIRADLRRSIEVIKQNTGHQPRALVWPYGNYSNAIDDIAKEEGLITSLSLDEGVNQLDNAGTIKRILVARNAKLQDVVWSMYHPQVKQNVRVAHVDLDYVYDNDPNRQEQNLGLLLDRIKELNINTVYLQAFADPDGDGAAGALYFPNRHLPVRADLFNRAVWQLKTRANVRVYAWMPVMAFDFGSEHPLMGHTVETVFEGKPGPLPSYKRLSIFYPDVRQAILEIYEDLAKSAPVDGLLFHDDALLGDYEDSSAAALAVYEKDWGLAESVAAIREDPELFDKWSKRKTQYLIDWTHELASKVKTYRQNIKTARNLYSEVVLRPHAETWYAQSLADFLEAYDYTAIMAMPYMENVKRPDRWLKKLVKTINTIPGATEKTVYELQSVDWRIQQPITSKALAHSMEVIRDNGGLNFGYYPDDFIQQHPAIENIRPVISLSRYPYR